MVKKNIFNYLMSDKQPNILLINPWVINQIYIDAFINYNTNI